MVHTVHKGPKGVAAVRPPADTIAAVPDTISWDENKTQEGGDPASDQAFRDLIPQLGYRVSEVPLEAGQSALPHFLDLFSTATEADTAAKAPAGQRRRTTVDMSVNEADPDHAVTCSAKKIQVYAALSFNELRDINPASESFQIRVRIYAAWRPRLIGRCSHSAKVARTLFAEHVEKAKGKSDSPWLTLTEAGTRPHSS